MEQPKDIDGLLKSILSTGRETAEEKHNREYLERMLHDVTHGKRGFFVTMEEDGSCDWMLWNCDCFNAISMLARWIEKASRSLRKWA